MDKMFKDLILMISLLLKLYTIKQNFDRKFARVHQELDKQSLSAQSVI